MSITSKNILKKIAIGVMALWTFGFGFSMYHGHSESESISVANTHVIDPVQSLAADMNDAVSPTIHKFSMSAINQMFNSAENGSNNDVGNQVKGSFDDAINGKG